MSKTSPSDILNRLEADTLEDLFLHDHEDQRGEKVKKKTMIDNIVSTVEQAGVKSLLASMKREELKTLAEKAGTIEWKKEDNKNSKTVLTKKLAGAIESQGINDFLTEHTDEEQLKQICAVLDVDDSGKKEELVKEIGNTVRSIGLDIYFSAFSVDSLQDVCEDLKLKTHNSGNKRKLVESIINLEDVAAPEKKKKKVEASKKKKPIEKGITFEDIFQHYYVGEVRDWCKEHDLKTVGKKTVLIKRILAYLEGDEESGKATTPKAKKANGGKGRGKKAKKEEHEEANDEKKKEEEADPAADEEEKKKSTKKGK